MRIKSMRTCGGFLKVQLQRRVKDSEALNATKKRKAPRNRSDARGFLFGYSAKLGVASDFKEEPGAALGFVDPVFEQAGGGYVFGIVAKIVDREHFIDEFLVVVHQLRDHVAGIDEFGVVVVNAL